VEEMCKTLGVSRSGYYKSVKRVKSKREKENEMILKDIKRIFKDNKELYGSPRITAELKAQGKPYNKKRIARLMNKHDIRAKTKKKFKVTTHGKHKSPLSEDLVKRNFTVSAPNRLWASDITYLWTKEGWLYLAVILDVYCRKIVGWTIDKRLNKELVITALVKALGKRKVEPGLIFHSDRGSQYASNEFRRILNMYKMKQSMSGKGDCFDNAVTESFFHTYKTEEVYFENYETRKVAKEKTFEYIEIYYNRKRRHSFLGYLTPEEFDMGITQNVA
jgi:transposase InsO family protein